MFKVCTFHLISKKFSFLLCVSVHCVCVFACRITRVHIKKPEVDSTSMSSFISAIYSLTRGFSESRARQFCLY